MVFFKKYLPIASLIIGTSALTFQIAILYPWHKELDIEFQELKKKKLERDKLLTEHNNDKISRINLLEHKIDELISEAKNKEKEGEGEEECDLCWQI